VNRGVRGLGFDLDCEGRGKMKIAFTTFPLSRCIVE
jgi:hypothetical protein